MKEKGQIWVILGLSASGKDSQCDVIKERLGFKFVISHTTRPMRPNESQTNPYYFVDDSEFEEIDMIERREYNTLVGGNKATWKYGVAENSINLDNGDNYVVVLDYQGYQEFVEYFGDDSVIGIYLEADEPTRRQRCIGRKDFDITEWERREIADTESFKGVKYAVDIIVDSIDVETTYEKILEALGI